MSPRRPSPAPFQQPDGRPLLATVTKAAEWLPATSTEITATIQRAGLQVAAVDAWGAQTYRMIELETALGVKRPTPGRRRPFDGAIGGTSGATRARRGGPGGSGGERAPGARQPPGMAGRRRVARQEVVVTVDSDQDWLMVAFNTVPPRLWVGGDPDWSLYAISERLAVLTGECPVHGRHQDVVLSLVNGQLHALGEASDPEQLGQLLGSHACLTRTPPVPCWPTTVLRGSRRQEGLRWSGSARCRATRMASL